MYQGGEGYFNGVKDVSRERRVYQRSEGCIKGAKDLSRE